jgi:hypothetical protein
VESTIIFSHRFFAITPEKAVFWLGELVEFRFHGIFTPEHLAVFIGVGKEKAAPNSAVNWRAVQSQLSNSQSI